VKLFGNMADCEAAMAEALRMANGFLPVKLEPLIILLVPEDLSPSLIVLLDITLFVPGFDPETVLFELLLLFELVLVELLLLGGPRILSSG